MQRNSFRAMIASQRHWTQPDFGARHKQCPKCGSIVRRFLDDQSGVTAVEYALIASLIGAVIIGFSFRLATVT